jgi:preprotein translocase subunit SecD
MNQMFTTSVALLLLILPGLGCSPLRSRNQLTWHVTLEIDTDASGRDEAITIIKRRLDFLGIRNSEVQAQGPPANARIRVSLPEVPDRERVKKIITSRGNLQLAAVVSPPNPAPVQIYPTREDAAATLRDKVYVLRLVLPYTERSDQAAADQNSQQAGKQTHWVVVESPAIVEGGELRNASAIQSRAVAEDYQIAFSLKPTGAKRLQEWTGTHINDYMAVVLNDEVKSIAFIKSQISDQGAIEGRFTKQSAEDLAQVLNSGPLPARVKIVDEGPNK